MTRLLRLLRWPGVLTAAADAATAGLLLAPCLDRGTGLAALAAALAYAGGVALNDVADAGRDATLHPERPLPSGAVSRGAAMVFAVTLLVLSPVVAWFAHPAAAAGYAGVVLAVLAYDLVLKRWAMPGAVAMGLCRGGSVLAAALAHEPFRRTLAEDPGRALVLPLPWFLHTVFLTLASRLEDRRDGMRWFPAAALAVAVGPAVAFTMLAASGIASRPAALVPLTAYTIAVALAAAKVQRAGRSESTGLLIREGVFGFLLLDAAALGARLPAPFPLAATAIWFLTRWALTRRRS